MMVDALQGMTAWTEPGKDMVNRDKTVLAKGQFSTMLRQLETGGGITDTGESSGEDTITVIQVMSDGSVLITVYEGDKLVSQTKTHAAHPEENPTILSTQVEKSAPDNAEEQLSASEQAVQMLNMLM
ncbi:MAG: hypothetical protein E7201_01365 [Selenomonas ruminantium]|uniref:Uncharacterized protein n=1 Tax=Selenomonas ruminantium TaxID=971 RepID=A0A927ZQH7_SELRU|nr:hypothetical protein [Selenomonas ruminantium]